MSSNSKKKMKNRNKHKQGSNKIKILAFCDAPSCATGFATVSRNIFEGLYNTGRYDIDVLGINYWGDPHNFPYRIWPVGTNEQKDPYGRQKVLNMIPQMDFDILFFLQDSFILNFLPTLIPHLKNNRTKPFKSILYYPVDSIIKQEWAENINHADCLVAYSEFGKKETLKRINREIYTIPHGINTNEFYPLPKEEVEKFKQQYFGPLADHFLVCFPEGHDVTTNRGIKDISEIEIGDFVLTHGNRFKEITKVFERDYVGDLVVISTGKGGNTISPTNEHPVFAIKRKDVLCKYSDSVKGKDKYVCRPKKDNVKYSSPCSTCGYYTDCVLDINKMAEYKADELEVGDFLISPIDMTTTHDKIVEIKNITKYGHSKLLPNKIIFSPTIMEMFGLWLADGCYVKNKNGFVGIVFTQLSERRDIIEKFKKGIKDGFGLECREYKRSQVTKLKGKEYKCEVSQVVCHSVNLANVFYTLFGEYSYGKFISSVFDDVSPELQLFLCLGYIKGDGCVRQNTYSKSYRFDIGGESLPVLKSIQRMCLRNKIITSIFITKTDKKTMYYKLICQGNGVSKITSLLGYEIDNVKDVRNRFFVGDYLLTEIKDITKQHYKGKVFNMEVKDDNSYIVNGIAVHNCNVNRNQQRKDIPRTIAAFKEFRKQVPKSVLYLHMSQKDQGWDLSEVCKSFELDISKDVIFPKNFGPNQGYPRDVLNMLYNCSDTVVSTTLGEGFGLCVKPDTCVYTKESVKKIGDVTIEDEVLSSDGTYNEVQGVMSKEHDGDLYEIITCMSNIPIKTSPDHGFLIYKDGFYIWKKAKELKINDILLFPKKYDSINNGEINVLEMIKPFLNSTQLKNIVERDDKFKIHSIFKQESGFVPKTIKITESLMKLFGLYLGGGCIFNSKMDNIMFSFYKKETDLIEFVIREIKNVFGLDADELLTVDKDDYYGMKSIKFYSSVVVKLFYVLFGDEDRNKKIHSVLLNQNLRCLKELIHGEFRGNNRVERDQLVFSIISRDLAYSIRLVLSRLGILSFVKFNGVEYKISISDVSKEKYLKLFNIDCSQLNKKHVHKYGDQNEDYLMLPIREINKFKYKGKLVDIQVKNTNNFVAENVVVHNSWLESMGTKTPIVMPDNTMLSEFITEETGWLCDSGADPSHWTVIQFDNEVRRPLVDVNNLVETLVEIHNNPEEAKRRAENAYKWVTTEMDWQKNIVKTWIKMFDKVYKGMLDEEKGTNMDIDNIVKTLGNKSIKSEML